MRYLVAALLILSSFATAARAGDSCGCCPTCKPLYCPPVVATSGYCLRCIPSPCLQTACCPMCLNKWVYCPPCCDTHGPKHAAKMSICAPLFLR